MAVAEQLIRPFADPTRGMSQISDRGPERAETRYLFQAGNLLDPERILQLEYLTGGGDEIATSCFRRSTNGFLPRASLWPLEVWGISIPAVHLADGATDNTVRLVTAMTPESLGMTDAKPTGGLLNIYGKENRRIQTFPGDEINGILQVNGSRGVVEVTSLRGQSWWADADETKPGIPQILNQDFFPGPVPIQLSRVEEMINHGGLRSALHQEVAKAMLRSCQVFRRYAQVELGVVHTLLRQRVSATGNWTYTYSGVHRSYLEQLEMQPQDIENSDVMMSVLAKLADRPEQTGSASPAEIAAIAAAVVRELTAKDAEGEQPQKNKGGRPRKVVEPTGNELNEEEAE